jgi:hypothetical protein
MSLLAKVKPVKGEKLVGGIGSLTVGAGAHVGDLFGGADARHSRKSDAYLLSRIDTAVLGTGNQMGVSVFAHLRAFRVVWNGCWRVCGRNDYSGGGIGARGVERYQCCPGFLDTEKVGDCRRERTRGSVTVAGSIVERDFGSAVRHAVDYWV